MWWQVRPVLDALERMALAATTQQVERGSSNKKGKKLLRVQLFPDSPLLNG